MPDSIWIAGTVAMVYTMTWWYKSEVRFAREMRELEGEK